MDPQGSQLNARRTPALDSSESGPRGAAAAELRVLIDARKLGHGGIGTYTENLITGMLALGESGSSAVKLGLLGEAAVINRYAWAPRVSVIEESARPYSLDELLRLGRRTAARIRAGGYHLYHAPHFVLPYGLPIPAVITVHDLIHVRSPQHRYYPWIAKPMIRSALRRAREVLTVSRATYDDLVDFSGRDAELVRKLHIIPNALDPDLRAIAEERRRSGKAPARRNYLAAVFSNLKPHKGLADLLQAFRALKALGAGDGDALGVKDLKLVLAGQGFELGAAGQAGRELLAQAEATPDVLVFGRLTKSELCNVYAEARALVVPALTEGFCLPVLEAQAFGTPVIARPVPAVRELLTPIGLISEDFTLPALVAALRRGLERGRSVTEREANAAADEVMLRYAPMDVARAISQAYRQALEPERFSKGR